MLVLTTTVNLQTAGALSIHGTNQISPCSNFLISLPVLGEMTKFLHPRNQRGHAWRNKCSRVAAEVMTVQQNTGKNMDIEQLPWIQVLQIRKRISFKISQSAVFSLQHCFIIYINISVPRNKTSAPVNTPTMSPYELIPSSISACLISAYVYSPPATDELLVVFLGHKIIKSKC